MTGSIAQDSLQQALVTTDHDVSLPRLWVLESDHDTSCTRQWGLEYISRSEGSVYSKYVQTVASDC